MQFFNADAIAAAKKAEHDELWKGFPE